jgi:hypothetical protein
MLRLVAQGSSIVLTDEQVTKAKYPLLEFLPAVKCVVHRGPGVEILVPGHSTEELMPAVLRAVEAAVGCPLAVEEAPDLPAR